MTYRKGRYSVHMIVFTAIIALAIVLTGCPSPVPPGGGGGGTTTVETPIISPSTGSSIQQDSAQITITCATASASIYYTVNGDAPTASSTPYAGAFAINSFAVVGTPLTVKAIGILSGSTDSSVAQADYVIVDTEAPIPVVTGPEAANAPFDVTITFNEDVTGFDDPALDITVTNGTAGAISGGPRVYTSQITPSASPVTVEIPAGACADGYANNNAASASALSVIYDPTAPLGVITSTAPDPTNTSPIPIQIDFGRSVQGFDASDVTVGNGSVLGGVSGGPQVYTADVQPSGQGAVTVDMAAGVCNATTAPYTANLVSSQFSRTYDTVAPDVTIDQAGGQADPANGTINFTVVFTESVSDFNDGCVALSGTAGATMASVTGSGTTYNVAVSGMSGDGTVVAAINAGVCHDAAGNGNTASTSTDNSVTYDGTAPTVTVNQAGGQPDPTNGSTINFTVVFSESVSDFATGDVTLSGTAGADTAVVTGSGTTYNVAVSGMSGDGTVIASIASGRAHDEAGNGNTASTSTDNTVTYDSTGPSVTINQAGGQDDPTNASPINFTVVFNQSVSDFATGDVTLSGTAGADTAVVTGSGTTYNVAVSGMSGDGTVIASIAAGVAHDGLGNGNSASTSTDNDVTYDATAPTVTINQDGVQDDPTNDTTILFTVNFSESVTGFATGDITLSGTAGADTAVVTGSGSIYNVAVSGMSGNGTVIASIASGVAGDAAGNLSAASTSTDNNVAYDGTAPTVTINQAGGQADPTNASPIDFTVVFSESVSDFATGDVSLSGTAGATTAVVTGSGTTYNVAVSGMSGNGTVIASIAAGVAHDAADNASGASSSSDNSVAYDATAPTVTIEQAGGQADPTNASPIDFTVVFSESVSDFATGDVSLSGTAGATTAVVTGSGTTYNVAVSGMTGSGSVTASLAAGIAHDAAGNNNAASTSADNSVTYDVTAPTVTINQDGGQTDPTSTSPIIFTVVFSESVTGFATGDVTISGTAGGTKTAAVSGSGANYTVSVSGMTSKGTVIASINAGVCTDAAGNNNEASTSTDNSVGWYNVATMIGSWVGGTTGNLTVTNTAGSNRILLVFANARRSNATPSLVTSVSYGGQALTKLSERTYNGANPTVTNSVWYLNEAGLAAATTTSLTITWNNAPTVQQNWARIISTVDQTTPYASLQGGDSTATSVTTTAAVNYTPGTIGFAGVSSITTAEGTSTFTNITMDQQESVSTTFEAAIGDASYTTTGSFTPSFTNGSANKQTMQAFVIQGY